MKLSVKDKDANLLLHLSEAEQTRLIDRIDEDYRHAIAAHDERINRYRDHVRRFYQLPTGLKGHVSKVALIQEQVLTKLAREYGAIFGQGAEVIADPRGDQDSRQAAKSGAMVSYKFLSAMKPQRPMVQFIFQRNLLGRAIAEMPYETKTYTTLDDAGERIEAVSYRGPVINPCAADDIVTAPIKNVQSLQEFPFLIHRQRMPYAEVLRMSKSGKFFKLDASQLEKLSNIADGTAEQDGQDDRVKEMESTAEGVIYGSSSGHPGYGRILVYRWYGRTCDDNGVEDELVVRYEPETRTLLSVQSLIDIYPKMPKRRPYIEGVLLPIGGYWGMGLAQALTMDEDELSANMDLFREGGEASVFPPIFVDPTSGKTADSIRLESRGAIDVANAQGVKQLEVRFDPQYTVLNEQMTRASVERRFGISDYIQGRDSARPTAPDTAAGTLALMNAGNERIGFDVSMLDLDVADILERVYLLESTMGDPNEWYRVTEQNARNLVGVRNGRFQMTEQERHGFYDFKLRMASGALEKEARRQRVLTVYELALNNPLIAMNPLALWNVTAKVYRELLDENFADVVPKPPDPGFSLPPADEWTKMLQGEPIQVNPMDDDQQHIQQHMEDAQDHLEGGDLDEKALGLLNAHVGEHVKQLRQKMLMQAMVSSLTKSLAGNTPQSGGLTYQPPVSQNLAELGTQMQGLMNPMEGQPGQGGQPGAGKKPKTNGVAR